VLCRQYAPQSLFGVFRRLGLHVPPTIADPMNMNIHADAGSAIANRHHQIGCFPTDPRERHQFVDGVRHDSAIHLQEATANLVDRFGFRPIKPDWKDRPFDLAERQLEQRPRCVRQREEPGAGLTGRLVFGSQTKETGDKNAEGVAIRLASDDADDRLLPLPDLALYDPEGSMDLLLTHGPERRTDEQNLTNRTSLLGEDYSGLRLANHF